MASSTTDIRYEAVLARDARFDDMFVYAVVTTGIYCVASCASRKPLAKNVRWFAAAADAERAGFRACRRCNPRARASVAPCLVAACRLIESHPTQPSLKELSLAVGTTPAKLRGIFDTGLGISPKQYADAVRIGRFRAIAQSEGKVLQAIYGAGYGSSSRLYGRAQAWLGMTPARYARGGQGERIRYTVTSTPLGPLLLAATERGLCVVRFGRGRRILVRGLREELARATLVHDAAGLQCYSRAFVDFLESGVPLPKLPLDVQATAFQARVWSALRRVKPGTTTSYAEVARAIGRPMAARAVGGAVAKNPVALAIPCHRVLPATGGVGNYRWGAARKRQVLKLERARK